MAPPNGTPPFARSGRELGRRVRASCPRGRRRLSRPSSMVMRVDRYAPPPSIAAFFTGPAENPILLALKIKSGQFAALHSLRVHPELAMQPANTSASAHALAQPAHA
ncbi:uncharacterized protein PITG_21850 [Phytophthora infestans T30-4]|uniref:Uncharacterized protein n=1 Tax=Phytophthora infestans (strain T30-4) TaxID=403677 RepID=D0P4M9_PHYIT|nr:uncharacterized protein PITG_21850 [Phytophthora infestans T30-4]EEY67739.1 hypothetical protein PITG_21850 [Phytophthora infestans T30-4]|eukprot:XP_002996921.1 hypothetical protein PITG_21850 [Phytophthora infestans T30-4]